MGGGGEPPVRVLDERAAGELVWMMSQVIEHGTGARARLPDGRPAAGKTGTTQAARDAWFIGFTADYVTGVWMGYDDNTPLSGTTGGGLPAEIWRETMVRVEDGLPIRPLPAREPAPAVARPQAPGPGGRGRDRGAHGGRERAQGPLRAQLRMVRLRCPSRCDRRRSQTRRRQASPGWTDRGSRTEWTACAARVKSAWATLRCGG